MRWRTSLATRTALVLLSGLLIIQLGGLALHALDRAEMLRAAQERDGSRRAMAIYRSLVLARPEQRADLIDQSQLAGDIAVALSPDVPVLELPPAPAALQRLLRADMQMVPLPRSLRPIAAMVHSDARQERVALALQMPEGPWMVAEMVLAPAWAWHSGAFLYTFAAMSAVAGLLTLWAVRRLIRPVATLAAAAEALGRDVNAPPLPESGSAELTTAAVAFNTMAARIRRFVDDRTQLLTAIGHDLRTPITRLRLRAEFMEDAEQRRRMVADLDELEAMVSATLAFGRDATPAEPAGPVDLAALVATVQNEAVDARPQLDPAAVSYCGPDHLSVVVRPVALKRALTNLVANALNYGGRAHAELRPPAQGVVTLHIDDDGPGIAADELELVFQPFVRLEASRNRETGGVGLGLSITRNILRAHGGDVVLSNRPGGGLRATVTLPA
ncbi:MAG: HAMP domain-containing protein [Acetobacteraceae bacterium]|nr:HAMP domain-containing protein [Acetobacteraceae bacterium]